MRLINSSASKYNIMLFTLVMILFFVNLLWISLDQAPPMWDQSHYLFASEELFHTLKNNGFIPFLIAYVEIFGSKAPLITILPLPFYYLFGNTYSVSLSVNFIFILLSSVYLYKLTTIITDKKTALISVFILNTFPLTFAMSREFLVEYGLMTFVVAWMYHIIRLDLKDHPLDAAALGIILGLGMLMKISFPLYIAAPSIFLLALKSPRTKNFPEHSLRNSAIVIMFGTFISGTWYFHNLTKIYSFVISSGYGDFAKHYGTGDVFSLDAVLAYWISLINTGLTPYYFLIFLSGLTFLAVRHLLPNNRFNFKPNKKYFFFIFIWILIPFVVFTFSVNKDYRYTLPYYPAIAIICASGIVQFASILSFRLLPITLLVIPLFTFFYISFVNVGPSITLGPFTFLAPQLSYAHAPRTEAWPNLEILNRLRKDSGKDNLHTLKVTLLFDHPYLNRLTLGYYSANTRSNIHVETVDYYASQTDEEIAHKLAMDSDYVLTKSDKPGPEFSNIRNTAIKKILEDGHLIFNYFDNLLLPDNSNLRFYRKGYPPNSPASVPLVLHSLGPSSTQAGVGFNIQPDGGSAIWAQGENITSSTIIVFDLARLHGFPSGKPDTITSPVPPELFATPGTFPVLLYDPVTGNQSNELMFQVK